MKESILCFLFPGKLLHIIQDQYIDHLVEMEKIITIVIPDRLNELRLELVSIDIQNKLYPEPFLYLNPDSLGQMCFPQPRCSVNQQRIKRCSTRILLQQSRANEPTDAVALNKIGK